MLLATRLVDWFGVPRQFVPRQLSRLLSDRDTAKAGRAMQATMRMQKLEIAKLESAFDGVRGRG